ncbi:hypothetical protein glysoja_030344 [Glycine soja]|uniref:Uncharacterized protein n=1 Tax=Glycine soja TaxID=3848 RepID=A0A0B2PFA3_GLYSO|nr:hypothetical protein glysoja_030344 [Glycine soja]
MENGKGLYVILFTLLLGSVQIKHELARSVIIFHRSGIVGCEVLMWVLLADILWYCMVNMLASLVAFLCFFNHIPNIFADHEMPIIEMQQQEEEV